MYKLHMFKYKQCTYYNLHMHMYNRHNLLPGTVRNAWNVISSGVGSAMSQLLTWPITTDMLECGIHYTMLPRKVCYGLDGLEASTAV